MDADQLIRTKFRVKHRDTLPYTGWFQSNRQHIAELIAELGFAYGAEIGVAKGHNARMLFRTIPNLKLIAVDPWYAYDRVTKEAAQARYEECLQRLSKYDVEYKRKTSLEASFEVSDSSLDFIYIDGLHTFDAVMLDLILWSPKVKKGGIVAGHDYYEFYQAGIIPAVNAYTRAHSVNEWYVTRDQYPSFFWVKK